MSGKKQPPPREPVAPAKKQAIDAPRQSVFCLDPHELVVIGLDTEDGPEHPLWDPTARDTDVDEELALSLGEHGQMQNILIRRNGTKCEVVAGRHRTRAARLWNAANPDRKLALRCQILRGMSDLDLAKTAVVENEHRRERDPLVKARLAERFSRFYSVPDAEICRIFRTNGKGLESWRSLLEMAPEVQEAISAGEVKPQEARQIRNLSLAEQAQAVVVAQANNEPIEVAAERVAPGHHARRRGSSHEPSTKPGVQLMIAKIKDESIPDDLPWRQVLSWAAGVSAFPVAETATEG